jgi:hypothetical protein
MRIYAEDCLYVLFCFYVLDICKEFKQEVALSHFI